MLDLEPATLTLTGLVQGVSDDQLDGPTPCAGTPLAALLDHVDGLALAFTAAATKTGGDQGPSADAGRLGDDWRPRIAGRLAGLAEAWKDPSAWSGTTRVAGMDFPGEVAAAIATNEVIVHGWDIARASGQSCSWPPELVEAAVAFVSPLAVQNPKGVPGMFGPPEPADGRTPFNRLLALTGRDPDWQPSTPGD
jgi:uncharacterized protein (TIGR03086 family)